MHMIESSAPRRTSRARIWRTTAAAALAATLLAGAVAPASAAVFAQYAAMGTVDAPRTAFHHHFYRGVPRQNRLHGTAGGADMNAVAAEADSQEEVATAYCADRFRSYDPASGTYLGYDGNEHACP